MKSCIILLVTLVLVFHSPVAFASNEDINIVADLFIVRPLGFASLVLGSAVYVVSLPFAAFTRSEDRVTKTFLEDPFNYTFKRPLGDFRSAHGAAAEDTY